MTDVPVQQPASNDSKNVKLIYILYLVGVVVGITSLVGVIMAYINKNDAPEWMQSHYQYQIRTFWIGLLYVFISALLMVVVIGFLLLLGYYVWLIVRCVKGLKALEQNQPIANPKIWLF